MSCNDKQLGGKEQWIKTILYNSFIIFSLLPAVFQTFYCLMFTTFSTIIATALYILFLSHNCVVVYKTPVRIVHLSMVHHCLEKATLLLLVYISKSVFYAGDRQSFFQAAQRRISKELNNRSVLRWIFSLCWLLKALRKYPLKKWRCSKNTTLT